MTDLKGIISHRSNLSQNPKQNQMRRRKKKNLRIKNLKIEIVNKNLKMLKKKRKKSLHLKNNPKHNLKNNLMSLLGKLNIKM